MIPIAFMMLVVFLAVAGMALFITRSVTRDHEKEQDRLHEPGAETLVYDVPDGQDPVDLTVALHRAGFPSVEDVEKGNRHVLVDCPHGKVEDRARVRAVIEQVHPVGSSSGGAVRAVHFADEG